MSLVIDKCFRCKKDKQLCLTFINAPSICKLCIDHLFDGKSYENLDERIKFLEEGFSKLSEAFHYFEESHDKNFFDKEHPLMEYVFKN